MSNFAVSDRSGSLLLAEALHTLRSRHLELAANDRGRQLKDGRGKVVVRIFAA